MNSFQKLISYNNVLKLYHININTTLLINQMTLLNIHENIKEKLEYFHSKHKIPNIIFHGPTGSGKRTIVHDFIHKIYENDKEKIKNLIKEIIKKNDETITRLSDFKMGKGAYFGSE